MTPETDLEGLAGELEGLRTELAALVDAATPASGYQALWLDGELQPWTPAALRLWEEQLARLEEEQREHDPERDRAHSELVHHLAVAHHACAHDLAEVGDDAAFTHFETALRHWATLCTREDFWRRAHRRLTDALEVPVGYEVVEEVRAQLPYHLLEPHLTMAARLRRTDPDRARRHLRLVTGSAFPAAVVAEARDGLVRELLDDVPRRVAEGRWEETLDTLGSWLFLDPDHPELLRALLFTGRSQAERLRADPYRRPRLKELLRRIETLARPGLDRLGEARGELARELARYEFLLALRAFGALGGSWPSPDALGSPAEVERARRGTREAVRRVERALELDPELPEDHRYALVVELRDRQVPKYAAWLDALEAQFLLTSPGIGEQQLSEVRRLLDGAAAHTASDPGLEEYVRSLENLLDIRRA